MHTANEAVQSPHQFVHTPPQAENFYTATTQADTALTVEQYKLRYN